MEKLNNLSLLWPEDIDRKKYQDENKLSQRCVNNLGLDMIARKIAYDDRHYYKVKKLFLNLCDNPEVIEYRLDILQDFINNSELINSFGEIFELIEQINKYKQPGKKLEGSQYQAVAWRLKMLEIYADCMQKLYNLLKKYNDRIKSDGMRKMFSYISNIVESDLFSSLQDILPELKEKFDSLSCITIGIKLNARLEPEKAIFLNMDSEPFEEKSFLSRLFGRESNQENVEGVSPFARILKSREEKNILQISLLKELSDVFDKVLTPVEKAISRFVNYRQSVLLNWKSDLCYYIGCARFVKDIYNRGLPMCKPEVLAKEERKAEIFDITDMTLALGIIEEEKSESEEDNEQEKVNLGAKIVTNNIRFGSEGRIYILTGPNQGGKTTFTRAVGIAQVLFQAGIYVPGSEARISPVDWIHTHFTEEEKPEIKDGRLGEESRRLSRIFYEATPYSLLLLNESLSSTSPGEGLYLLKNIIKGIKTLRSRAIFTTHLHRLALKIDEINEEIDNDTKVGSLVAEVERNDTDSEMEAKRTFRIKNKSPQGLSYAKDIAHKYGISFEQIMQTLKNRDYEYLE